MGSRLDLHELLCEIVNITDPTDGDRHVYFQPPESLKMKYRAIRYSLNDIDNDHADDGVYIQSRSYELILIDQDPDSELVDAISRLPKCRFNRHYKADNLNHWVFTIFY